MPVTDVAGDAGVAELVHTDPHGFCRPPAISGKVVCHLGDPVVNDVHRPADRLPWIEPIAPDLPPTREPTT